MTIVERVRSKLDEYGLEIYTDYSVETEHVFYVEDMMIFVDTKKETIGVSFQATTKPERAGNIVLILNEMNHDIDVMESFIYDQNNRCLTGNKAFELVVSTNKAKTIQEFLQNQTYNDILLSSKCFEC